MTVTLLLKRVRKSHKHKKMIIRLLIIMTDKASDERVGGPLGFNILYGFEGFMAPGLKSLSSVEK